MPRRDFEKLLNTRYAHRGGFSRLTEIMSQDATTEDKIITIAQQFGVTFRQAARWMPRYREITNEVR